MSDASTLSGPSVAGYVRLSGHVDVATVPHFAGEVIRAVQTAKRVVTVDVSAVTYIDSTGLDLLADVLALGTARGHTVALQGASAELRKQLLLCGMESLFWYR